jgi:6-pyruvoyltetrahydropterin/6-carboxytetrahydropterin synthase
MLPRATLIRRYHFSASHRLHAESLTAEANREAFGKCNNPHGHGHNYVVTVSVSGPVERSTGMVVNLADLDGFAQEHLLDVFHLNNLNTLPSFATVVPTTENLAIEVYRIFAGFPGRRIDSIGIEETGNNAFLYHGPGTNLKSRSA